MPVTLFFCCIAFICSSCSQNSANQSSTGQISVRISNGDSKDLTIEDSSIGAGVSNLYEVCVFNDTCFVSTTIDQSESTVTIPINEGTYSLLVLAGYGTFSRAVLLGSVNQVSVVVEPDKITTVNASIKQISHSFTVPSDVNCMEEYSVSVSGDTNNEMLFTSINGSTMDYRPYIEIGEDATNRYLTCTQDGTGWNGTIECTAPIIEGETVIRFYGSCINLTVPLYDIDMPLKDLSQIFWIWPSALIEQERIDQEVRRNVTFAPNSTGLSVSIDWQ